MKWEVEKHIHDTCHELYQLDLNIDITRPDEQFGDFSTNVALQLAKKLQKAPRDIADEIANFLRNSNDEKYKDVTIAGPGFINIKLQDHVLFESLSLDLQKSLTGKKIVVEYSDPNPFKVLHAGHLYTTVVGDVITRILETAGAEVHRLNYGGDVGLHVGKTMWAIVNTFGGEYPEKLDEINDKERPEWLSDQYVKGNIAYEVDESAKNAIRDMNKRIYEVHSSNDHDTNIARIYWNCRDWSYEGFNDLYKQLQVHEFERYVTESEVTPIGLELVNKGVNEGVFVNSDGAVVFEGEEHGLHTRVFINSEGLPTYEAKELGLAALKWQDYGFDLGIIITANDIVEYMKVVLQSLKHFYPEIVDRSKHFTHGMIKLPGGKKMSSRKGNILRASDIIQEASKANKLLNDQENMDTVLGAIKYAFLKNRIGGDIIYDPEQSVSLEGNSGPYLQYSHARAKSILSKSEFSKELELETIDLEKDERSLIRKISEFSEVFDASVVELLPHNICTYLYELAQNFNYFYEHNRVIGEQREQIRIYCIDQYAETLKKGLGLLGIVAPDRM